MRYSKTHLLLVAALGLQLNVLAAPLVIACSPGSDDQCVQAPTGDVEPIPQGVQLYGLNDAAPITTGCTGTGCVQKREGGLESEEEEYNAIYESPKLLLDRSPPVNGKGNTKATPNGAPKDNLKAKPKGPSKTPQVLPANPQTVKEPGIVQQPGGVEKPGKVQPGPKVPPTKQSPGPGQGQPKISPGTPIPTPGRVSKPIETPKRPDPSCQTKNRRTQKRCRPQPSRDHAQTDDDVTKEKAEQVLAEWAPEGDKERTYHNTALGGPQPGRSPSVKDSYELTEPTKKEYWDFAPLFIEDTEFPILDDDETTWLGKSIKNRADNVPKGSTLLEIMLTWHKPSKGIVVIDQSYNIEHDVFRKQQMNEKVVHWSDMLMDTWRISCTETDNDIKKLRYIIRHQIEQTTKTFLILESLVTLYGKKDANGEQNMEQILKFDRVNPQHDLAFRAILGSPHGARVDRMLADYHEDLGKKKIKQFAAYRQDVAGKLWQMVIVLEG